MNKLLPFVGIEQYSRFRAVDSHELYNNSFYLDSFDQAKNIKLKKESDRDTKTLARKATWLSYLFLFKNLASYLSKQPILILEDDIDLEVDFVKQLNNSMKEAPNDWDVLLFGYCCIEKMLFKPVESKLWIPVKHFSALHCFVLRNSTVASRIARLIDVEVVNDPIDIFIATMAKSNVLAIYAHVTQIAIQRRDLFGTNNPDSGKLDNSLDKLRNSSIQFLSTI